MGKPLSADTLEFIELARATDSAAHEKTDLIVDTNVKGEIYTLGDLCLLADELVTFEACLASQKFRYRQHRARHSIVLAWHLAQQRKCVGFLGAEGVQIITGTLAPDDHPLSFGLTTSIVYVIIPIVLEGLRLGTLVHVDHHAQGTAADDEILRIAVADHLPVITWEAFNTDRTFSSDVKKLRNRCRAAGVAVYTPEEYLVEQRVDVVAESARFLDACEQASWTVHWERLDGRLFIDDLIRFYRFILLDDVGAGASRVA